MNLKITKKEENPALSLTYVDADLFFESTIPSRKDVTALLAKKMSTKDNLVNVLHIRPEYGYKNAKVEAICYNDPKVKEQLEPKWVKSRLEGKKKEPKKEEKPAAPPPTEEKKPEGEAATPSAEEKKEEKKVAEKAE